MHAPPSPSAQSVTMASNKLPMDSCKTILALTRVWVSKRITAAGQADFVHHAKVALPKFALHAHRVAMHSVTIKSKA